MIKKWTVLAALLLVSVGAFAQEKVEFALFVSPTCGHCQKLKREYWDKLQAKYNKIINLGLI